MAVGKIMAGVVAVAAVGLLLSCAGSTTSAQRAETVAPATQEGMAASLRTRYLELARAGGGKVFNLDPKLSAVRIYVFRGGQAAKLGHNHVLSAPEFTGFVYLPASDAADAKFDLEFRLDRLELDNPEYRSAVGGTFATALPAGAVEGARKHMLGVDNLQADRFSFVRIRSVQLTGELPRFAAQIEVEMHGQARTILLPLSVEGLPGRLSVTGAFVLKQTDFGIEPYSVLGGLLAVKDAVVVEFNLVGT